MVAEYLVLRLTAAAVILAVSTFLLTRPAPVDSHDTTAR